MKRGWLLALLLLAIAALSWDIVAFLRSPLVIAQKPVDYIFKPGSGIVSLSNGLSQQGLINRPVYFMGLAVLRGDAFRLKAGEYRIMAGTTPIQLLNQIVQGKVLMHQITLVEGWTFQQFLAALRQQPRLVQTVSGLSPDAIMAKLGYAGKHPEGRFFPDTYRFTRGTSDLTLLKQAYAMMEKRLAAVWETRASNLPYQTPYEALIVASLVEKETAVNSERPRVAGVILNRIHKKMLLQIDPTVIYGLGDRYTGRLRKVDLQSDSPYNTYRYAGLPPTPIAMPGAASLQAAMHPVVGDDVYFVAKGDGSHQFSKTLADHNQAVKNYILNK